MPRERGLKIVYDIDDVLWSLNRRVAEKFNIPLEEITDFDIHETNLSRAMIEKMIKAWQEAETFSNINFFPGVERLLEVEKLGATVYINSSAYSDAVVEQKWREIRRILPNMPEEHISIYNPNDQKHTKTINDDVLVFVDDAPRNVAKSKAKYTLVPRLPWNSSAKAKNLMDESISEVIMLEEFSEILEKVTEIVKQETGNQ